LVGVIGDRVFRIIDINDDKFLDQKEFIKGMSLIYCSSILKKIDFIFSIYDFDNDGFISKDDVRMVLSHCPIESVNCENDIKKPKEGLLTSSSHG